MQSQLAPGVGLSLRAPFMKAVEDGQAEGRVDFFEVSPENFIQRGGKTVERVERIAKTYPVTTHGLMLSIGGVDPLDETYIDELNRFFDRFDTPLHGDHLCFTQHEGVLLHELFPVPFNRATAARVTDRIGEAQQRLQRPFMVENTAHYMEFGRSEMDEADFLSMVLEGSDGLLLLDVNNLYLNAQNHGFDAYDWLARAPIERTAEIHIAGHQTLGGTQLLLDNHGAAIIDPVYALLEWVLERIGDRPILLERDAHMPPLSELLDEVDLIQRVRTRALAKRGEVAHG